MKIYIGFDRREPEAYNVCVASIAQQSPEVKVLPIIEETVRAKGLFWRPQHPDSNWDFRSDASYSTQFAFTRFLVPFLARHQGWALFCDSDFLFTEPLEDLFALADPTKAVMVRKHQFSLKESEKMDGQAQLYYARKWWSALVLWNCEHPANRALTLERINSDPGRCLHAFDWLSDDDIGDLPERWHWLEGYSTKPATLPAAIHYTRGIPIMPGWENVDYASLWMDAYRHLPKML